jgi:hypothetical protein
MRLRSRTPTLFSLSMLDVMVCALGCVTLLWLLNMRDSNMRAKTARETLARLTATRDELDRTADNLTNASRDADERKRELDTVRGDLADALARLSAAAKQSELRRKEAELQRKEMDALATRAAATDEELALKRKEAEQLTRDVTERKRQAADLEKLLREERSRAETADKSAKSAAAAYEARDRDLKTEVSRLQKQLVAAKESLVELDGQKRTVAEQFERFRAAADNRFAGVALTGRRVVFLVDMSGSMDLIDDKTPAPEKWPAVAETVEKVMKSLPDLEKFQVVLFSEQTQVPVGLPGVWNTFDRATSPARVRRELLAVKPKGNTDMYGGFEAAFRLRDQGLDTIYLFSDGLPNIGAGLLASERTLNDQQKTDKLARHVRAALRTDWNRAQAGKPRVKVNAIGFFYESPEVGAFLWALTRENDGSFVGMSRP